jgi:two-component system chemotaxis response regulator CheB
MEENQKIRVLVVDDSSVMRRIIATALAKHVQLEVVGYASNGLQALLRTRELNPDVVTLDLEMPELDGLSTLREIRKANPSLPIIMFSTMTHRGAQATVMALTAGATDYVAKPTAAMGSMNQAFQVLENELIPKIVGLAKRSVRRRQTLDGLAGAPKDHNPAPVSAAPLMSAPRPTTFVLSDLPRRSAPVAAIVIGVSTGGPMALKQLFAAITVPLSVPVYIVQHMPASFTPLLAARLTASGSMTVKEPVNGEIPLPGMAYMAPGGLHMVVTGSAARVYLGLNQEPPQNSCRPSVDVLFQSAAQVYGESVLAVVLTGMGYDGVRGCQDIKSRNGQVIVQDEESSVVWGMPGAVSQQGLADLVLPLDKIADELVLRSRRTAPRPRHV